MTSMLYTSDMNNTAPIPNEVILFDRQFSWRRAWRVARWWFVAFILSAVFDVIFPGIKRHWPEGLRVALVFGEFIALIPFYFDAARWIRGMDELQRRITLELLLFSVSASFCFFVAWLCLAEEGFFNAVFGRPFWNHTWQISSVAHACVLLGGFYGLGFLIFKRRYK
jgi:hypothetical protein